MRSTRVAELVAEQFGVALRTAWNDVTAAQDDIVRQEEKERPHRVARLIAQGERAYEIATEQRDVRGMVAALNFLSKITGANAPTKIEVNTSTGVLLVPATPATTEEWLATQGEDGPR